MIFFFFKQKTAYEMRISDWSSDVCSSDLDYTIDQVVQLAEWQLRDKETRETVLLPLTKWALVGPDNDTTFQSLVEVLHESIPEWKVCFEIGRASCRDRVCQYV